MSPLDWVIAGFAAILASLGFRRGFIVGVLSFGGFAIGAVLGTRLAPLILPKGAASPYAPAFGLIGAVVAGAILASGLEGVGLWLRRGLMIPGMGVIDGMLGAALGAALGLGIFWILAAVVAQSPGHSELRADIQRSAILRELNLLLPPSGPILDALSRLDSLPSITGPSPDVASPEPRIAHAAGVRAAAGSVVRVIGTACGLAVEGSGWVIEPGVVITNAHVVAGEQDTTVEVAGRPPGLATEVVAFNPTVDLAVLEVPGLHEPALELAREQSSGTSGAILGYPENGPFDVQAARIGRTQRVITQDAYGRGPVSRLLTPLRGLVRPGNSGGPLVDAAGQVLTTIFAGTIGHGPAGGYGVADETVERVLAQANAHARTHEQVSTEECTEG
jgi:S1-C subfamily serine protease